MSGKDSALWQLASELRSFGTPTLDMLALAKERGVAFSHEDVQGFIRAARDHNAGELVVPSVLPSFITEALSGKTVEEIVDPWAGIGSLLDGVAVAVGAKDALAMTPNAGTHRIAQALSRHESTTHLLGEPLELLADVPAPFDVVVSVPPWGMRAPHETTIEHAGKAVAVRDDLGLQVFLKACSLLKDDGVGFGVVTSRFFFATDQDNARDTLPRLGLHLDAALYLPPQTFAPFTAIPTYLIVVGRQQHEHLFVAELGPHTDIKKLVKAWRQREPGRHPRLGALVDPEDFRSLDQMEHEQALAVYAQKNGLSIVKLTDAALELNRESKEVEGGFEDKPNTVYLPLIGTSEAVSGLSELRIKPQNYAQIVLDEEKVLAEYVARFFNTEMGRMVRHSLLRGATIPKISLASLREAVICVPPLDTQVALVEVESSIADLRSELARLDKQLWEQPRSVERVRKALKHLNREEGIETWIESLPFPLASILFRYSASAGVRLKEEHLLHFFEALAQFLVTLMLSAIVTDDDLIGQNDGSLISKEDIEGLRRTSFGGWCVFGAKLAKRTRTGISGGEDERNRFLWLYRRRTPDFVEMVTGKALQGMLLKTCGYRNAWKGHGGVESEREARRRVALLELELARTREIVGDGFEGSMMCRPGPATHSGGIFTNTVKSLTGSNPTFREVTVETTIPMDQDILYFVEEGNPEPLALLPLMKMGPTPESEEQACYFYNRIEKDGVRWVSYHFEKEAEIVDNGAALREVLDSLAARSDTPE